MIVSVVREHHWPPKILGGLFIDAIDYKGLEFWYNDCLEVEKQIKEGK